MDAINGDSVGSTATPNVTASIAGGQLVLTADNADVNFTVGGTADVNADFGIAPGAFNSGNLITQGAVAQNDTLVIQVGANAATTITFGTGGGEVSTIAELQAALTTGTVAGTSAVTVGATGDITLTATSVLGLHRHQRQHRHGLRLCVQQRNRRSDSSEPDQQLDRRPERHVPGYGRCNDNDADLWHRCW